ncbi:sugar-binding transcriptional regulator [Enterococcus saccharolyticus]|uniref:Cro/Cl family transcriptional regulator n=1 Tax=Candidatus Enterococcus willemsii TaxID=1857215 RepID=A0ABQ6Z367_9ENTE|nr:MULTISPECIES: sugar-binding transcriptional regulator [Enterococcus]KAF1306112.1 Cro/Cl family transcriptional regulator [Enterococcus sp. CU12B]MCD5002290.1 sugar-binding transcriptional regulator [Enterococcus saccharolyticus]
MKDVEDKLLVKIAQMYYQEDKNQSQISKELNIHRSTISRLLKKSREEGIVNISINYDLAGTYSLEKELEAKYDLLKAIVVPTAVDIQSVQKVQSLGKATNEFLQSILVDDMIIGFSWGQAMSVVSEELNDTKAENLTCIPLIGGPAGRLISEYHVNTITYTASKVLNAKALLIDAPAFPETKELKDALLANEFNQELLHLWKKLSVAIFGIGSPQIKDSDRWQLFYGEDVLSQVNTQVAGDVVSRFYDVNGEHIPNDLDNRLIGISIEDLKAVQYRIAVAESLEKVEAIKSALLGKYMNVLVTTQETADAILNE